MSHSDRSRSPTSRRSGSTLTRADLPGFPVWRGPMGHAVRAAQMMPNSQQILKWSGTLPGAYNVYPPQMYVRPVMHSAPSPSHPFRPTPLTQRPPTFITSSPPPPSIPASHNLLNLVLPLSHVHQLLLSGTALHTILFRLSVGFHTGIDSHPHFLHRFRKVPVQMPEGSGRC